MSPQERRDRERQQRVAASEAARRLAGFLRDLMPMLGVGTAAELSRFLAIDGSLYNYTAGAPNAAARHVALVCDRVGINVARVMLGAGDGAPARPWFVDPRHQGLDFENPAQRADVIAAMYERLRSHGVLS